MKRICYVITHPGLIDASIDIEEKEEVKAYQDR